MIHAPRIASQISLVRHWPAWYFESVKGGEEIWQGLCVCVWHNRLRRMMFRFEYNTLSLLPLSEHISPGCKDSITPVNPAVACSQPRILASASVSNRWYPAFVIKETSSRIIRCISDKSLFFPSFTAYTRRSIVDMHSTLAEFKATLNKTGVKANVNLWPAQQPNTTSCAYNKGIYKVAKDSALHLCTYRLHTIVYLSPHIYITQEIYLDDIHSTFIPTPYSPINNLPPSHLTPLYFLSTYWPPVPRPQLDQEWNGKWCPGFYQSSKNYERIECFAPTSRRSAHLRTHRTS